MWKLFQLSVFLAVSFTGIYYKWTPNGLVLGLVAAFCAFGATVLLSDLFRFLSWCLKTSRVLLSHERKQNRLSGRR